VQGAIVTIDPGSAVAYALPANQRAFVYVLSGQVNISGRTVLAGQTAWSDPSGPDATESLLHLTAPDRDKQAQLMIYSGQPIREPVAMGGPFVMNKRTEITQAFADFHAGKFGDVPRQARLKYR
jgi:redox-sensitive bicupin YhaK (pirin superfamily)